MSWVEIVADRKIREAQDDGRFDNLPGKGRPLNLEGDLLVAPEWRAAYRLMREVNVLPDWIQAAKDLREAIGEWEARRAEFAQGRERAVARRGAAVAARECEVDEVRNRFLRRAAEGLRDINRAIDSLNLIVPTPAQQRSRLPAVARMEELEIAFPPLTPSGANPGWREILTRQPPSLPAANRIPPRRSRKR